MSAQTADDLQDPYAHLADASAEEVIAWAYDHYHPSLGIITAFQAEGMVLIDLAWRVHRDVRVFTVDTGRLPQETYDLMDEVRSRYGIVVEVIFPDPRDVETMVERHGLNLFRHDPALRQLCCQVRKVFPFQRAVDHVDAYFTGLRRSQGVTREDTPKVQEDPQRPGKIKVSPLADWSVEQVWDYIRANRVPHHALYDQGYRSIGCAPCTRPVQPGQPERSGRWWWEPEEGKECGLHRESRSDRLEEELRWLRANR
ncbi:MAG: phosphoadenylyl-sulfate reductase [Actinomycetota bacterium]